MRKINVLMMMSLDGVIQAPGGPGEDTSGGFKYGGWSFPYMDEVGNKIVTDELEKPFELLLGKKTYDIWEAYWPKQSGPIADPFNKTRKYVATRHPFEPEWKNTTVLTGDVVSQIKELKKGKGSNFYIYGSGNFIQTLLKEDLVDELWLRIFPITLGTGKKLFAEGTIPTAFKLTDSKISPSGVIFANYRRAGEVKTGSFV